MPDYATFYCPEKEPISAGELRRLAGDADVHEARIGLRRRLQHVTVRWPEATVTFRPMEASEVPGHLQGFVGFVYAHATGNVARLEQRVRSVQQVIGATIEPGHDTVGRVERLLAALASSRRALVVRPAGVFDEHGQPALAPRAPQLRDEPQLLGSPPPPVEEATPPAADRVARRALALAAVVLRGSLEHERLNGRETLLEQLRDAVERHHIAKELEAYERALLNAPLATLTTRDMVDATWRAEGLVVLCWALGVHELPVHDQMADIGKVVHALGLMAPDLGPAAAQPRLRPPDELTAMSKHLLGLHWRLRDFSVRPRGMDFAAFARRCWFGCFDSRGVPLVGGDLAIDGVTLRDADPRSVARASSIATERHRAINWLIGDDFVYSEVDVST